MSSERQIIYNRLYVHSIETICSQSPSMTLSAGRSPRGSRSVIDSVSSNSSYSFSTTSWVIFSFGVNAEILSLIKDSLVIHINTTRIGNKDSRFIRYSHSCIKSQPLGTVFVRRPLYCVLYMLLPLLSASFHWSTVLISL
jgi:hypothetical protein